MIPVEPFCCKQPENISNTALGKNAQNPNP